MKYNNQNGREFEAPEFSAESVICQTSGWRGQPVSVVVDRAAGMIHFQNCYVPQSSFWMTAQPWFSYPLSVLKIEINTGRNVFLHIQTPTGRAIVSPRASNFRALREALAEAVPDAYHDYKRQYDGPGTACSILVASAGGGLLGFLLTPSNASLQQLELTMLGGAIVATVAVFLGMKLIPRSPDGIRP